MLIQDDIFGAKLDRDWLTLATGAGCTFSAVFLSAAAAAVAASSSFASRLAAANKSGALCRTHIEIGYLVAHLT